MFYLDKEYIKNMGKGFLMVSLFFTSLFAVQDVSATGGAFNYTKHGGGTTDSVPPYDVGNGPGVDRSVNADHYSGANHYNELSIEAGKYKAGECPQCHELHASFGGSEPAPNMSGDAGPDAYLGMKDYGSTTNYSNLCWYCHQYFLNINGTGSPLSMGKYLFYQGQTIYQASSHFNDNNMYWPGDGTGSPVWPRKDRFLLSSGNRGSCVNCHTPHGIKAANPASAYDTSSPDGTGGVPASMQTVASGNPSVNEDYLIPRQTIAWEETLCERCHDSSGPATSDIQSEINKRHFFEKSGHPVDDTSLAGRHVASEDLPITTKHVECYDCHNPHAAKAPSGFLGDGDAGRLQGMKYIDIDGIVRDPASGDRQPYIQEVCFKCHGDSFDCIMPNVAYGAETTQPACIDGPRRNRGHVEMGMGYNSQKGASNKRKEFNPNTPVTIAHGGDGSILTNGGYHPVSAAGRNHSIQLCNQLKKGFPTLTCTNTVTAAAELSNLTINCTDCHNNEVTGTISGPVTESSLRSTDKVSAYLGSEPVGPHGSDHKRILRANYNTEISTNNFYQIYDFSPGCCPAEYEIESNFALCFLCHYSTPFRNSLPSNSGLCTSSTNGVNNCDWSNFYADGGGFWGNSLHYYHLRMGSPDGIYMKCHECHNNVHSNVEANNIQFHDGTNQGYPADGKTHLLNFGPSVKADSFAKPAVFWDESTGMYSCNLKCHGYVMKTCAYKGKEDDAAPGEQLGTCHG